MDSLHGMTRTKCEVHLLSDVWQHHSRKLEDGAPFEGAYWDGKGQCWVADLSLSDILLISRDKNCPVRVLAVGGDDEDLTVVEIEDVRKLPHKYEVL